MFKCKYCNREIEKEIDDYYRKKYNKEIGCLQDKIKNMRVQLAIYYSNQRKYGWHL
jgi:hypothetical protein